MFAHKSKVGIVYRILLIAIIVSNVLVPETVLAISQGENTKVVPLSSSENDLASEINLGSPGSQLQQHVSILSEQIAEQAQQQEEKPIQFKVFAEPAIFVPGKPISLRWKVQNLKPDDEAAASVVIHAPSGVTPLDPNVIFTPDGLANIPLSGKKDVSEWNVGTDTELPIYFTLDLSTRV